MSCYIKNMSWMFKELGVDDNEANHEKLDKIIRETYEVEGDDCDLMDRKFTRIVSDDSLKQRFTEQIKAVWSK